MLGECYQGNQGKLPLSKQQLILGHLIAKCLSARLITVQCSQFTFVCMYADLSHFNWCGQVDT